MFSTQTESKNSIFKIIAVLLCVNLLVMINNKHTPLVSTAQAADSQPKGIPNAGAQRKQMIERLDKLADATNQLADMLADGKARVRVENLDEIPTSN